MTRKRLRTVRRLPIVAARGLGTAAIAGILVTGCNSQRPEPLIAAAQAKTPAAPVQITQPFRRDVSRLITLPGEIRPWQEATLYAKVAGYLDRITVDKGDHVRAGQVLAVIRAPELEADRDQAQQTYAAGLAAARGNRTEAEQATLTEEQARLAAEKASADYAQGPAGVAKALAQAEQARSALQQARAQKTQAESQRDEARAQVAKAQADLESAQADGRLAEQTYARYKAVYDKDHALIAREDVDTYESRAQVAQSRVAAEQSQVETAQQHAQSAAAQVAVAEAQIAQAQSQVAVAQEQVGILRSQQTSLAKQKAIAESQVRISQRQREAALAKAEAAQKQASAAGAAVGRTATLAGYTQIRAPFAGVVVQRSVDPGAFIQTAAASQNAASLVTVAQVDRMRLYVNVPETEAGFVQVGTPVQVLITGSTVAGRAPLRGNVARTSESLDPKTRTLLAEVDLRNPTHKLLPGAYASVKVVLETHKGVLSVPTRAVHVEKSGKFVFVMEGGKAKRLPVTAGFNDGAYTEIVKGLSGDEPVVVLGGDTLTPGAPVTATAWTGSSPSPAPGR